MANEQNLKPFVKGEQRQKDLGKEGGIASGEAKREKKLFKEEIERQLGASIKDIIKANIKEAKNGNIQASIFLRDTIGEKPTDKIEAGVDGRPFEVNINVVK